MGNDDDALLLIFRPAFESRRRHFFFSFFFLVLFFFPFCCLFSFFTSLFACLLLFRVLSLLIAVMGTCIDLYAFSVMIVSVQSSPEFALFIAVSGICYHNYYNLTCLFIFFFFGWLVDGCVSSPLGGGDRRARHFFRKFEMMMQTMDESNQPDFDAGL